MSRELSPAAIKRLGRFFTNHPGYFINVRNGNLMTVGYGPRHPLSKDELAKYAAALRVELKRLKRSRK